MNLLTMLFSACLHIIIVMIAEGVVLFAVFMPLINTTVDWIIELINNKIYNFMNPNSTTENDELILDPKTNKFILNPKYDNSHDRHLFVNNKWIDNPNYNPLYTLFTPSQKSILRYGVVDEVEYFSKQEYVSYIIYAFILLALVTLLITIVIISKKYNIPIDYKFSIINTIIVTILIGGYAFVVMWYSVFNPYTLHIQKSVYETIMDFYKSV